MSTSETRQANRLALETSPYLLQHAHNPVDWFPWGPAALERAATEDKPILLSIGYAACHWCHVMERESFENDAVASVMNEHFVCVKVDREERPDLDDIYMAATVAMTGHGGWPMTVFLTPDQKPFFAGTYFPPTDREGQMGFPSLLVRIADMWKNARGEILEQAAELTEHVRAHSTALPGGAVGEEALNGATAQLIESFDSEWGGFGSSPKFPPCAALELLLRVHRRRPEPTLLDIVRKTLDGMKNGGIYDHLAGGFARYSTDERWLVPHFEKMLYDNAQLARVYLQAYQVTKDDEYRRVATETLDYVIREMQGAEGGYFSATDADSEGVEGKFFVWAQEQIDEELGRPESEWFCLHHDVSPSGNWEGANILNTPRSIEDNASELGISPEVLRASLASSKQKLYQARQKRVPPLTDDKVLAAWNGMMIGAMAEGARVLGEPRFLASAERAARFLMETLMRKDGGLYRTARAGKAHIDAYLEDYAFVADGLVDLFEAGGDEIYVREAERLAERMLEDFGDASAGAFFQTASGHEALIARSREGHDGAVPNGNAVAARVLGRLAAHFGRDDLRERALAAIAAYGKSIERSPRAFATTLGVVDFLLEGPVELGIVGDPASTAGRELLRSIALHFLPNRVIAHARDPEMSGHPLLSGKALVMNGPALYVCRHFTCQAPVTAPSEVARVLGDASRSLEEDRSHVVGERRLAGAASATATADYASRFEGSRGKTAFTSLGTTGLTVSRAGFGSYRVDDRMRIHREALQVALTSGVNLIDTSTNYADGHSERLVGEIVAELVSTGALRREEIVVVSKIGYAQGQNLQLMEEHEAAGNPFPEVISVGEGLAHCIHPSWLDDQLGRSLSRLSMDTLDVCLLHNPEYFLGDAAKRGVPLEEARTEFYRHVTEAFRHLEREVENGRIRFYGVSSNTVGHDASGVETTNVARFLEAAQEAGGDAHHFRVMQLPLNLFETGAALVANAGPAPSDTAVAVALANGIAVLVNRPLNAITDDRLIRLADPPDMPEAPDLGGQLTKVRTLEEEFAKTVAPSLRPGPNARVKPTELFRWADALGDAAMRVDSFESWRDVETQQVAPRILDTLSALERAITGPLAPRFAVWKERYLTEVETLFAVLRRRAAERSLVRSRRIGAAIDPHLPEDARKSPLSQKALRVLLGVPGVTSVLVGMRHQGYVEDVLGALGTTDVGTAVPALRALESVEIR